MTQHQLPPLPEIDPIADHPELGRLKWSALEIMWIQDYATRYALAAIEHSCTKVQVSDEQMALRDALRKHHNVPKPTRYPLVGDIVEVDGKIGVCTEYSKGWCYVRQLDDYAEWLDFIVDEARHGKCQKSWRIRDDFDSPILALRPAQATAGQGEPASWPKEGGAYWYAWGRGEYECTWKPQRGVKLVKFCELTEYERADWIARAYPKALAALQPTQAAQGEPGDGRGTDAQIEKEREIARHAIVGALAAGYAGAKHPGADHWLAAAHDAGERIKALESLSIATNGEAVIAWQSSDNGSSFISDSARARNKSFQAIYTLPLVRPREQPAQGAQGEVAAQTLNLENAPNGTKAPAHGGGHWKRVDRGWKWCTGSTFPRPGADWTGELIAPTGDTQPAPVVADDTKRLDALARPGWELSQNNDPECRNDELWQVHRVSGGRNDREWTLIGQGADPRAAIDAALAASQKGGAQ